MMLFVQIVQFVAQAKELPFQTSIKFTNTKKILFPTQENKNAN